MKHSVWVQGYPSDPSHLVIYKYPDDYEFCEVPMAYVTALAGLL